MKKFLMLSLFLAMAVNLFANQLPTKEGIVLEHQQSGGYSYIKFQEGKEVYWVALPVSDFKVNDKITIKEQMWMNDFKSKSLDKTFDRILFATHGSNRYSQHDTQPDETPVGSLAEAINVRTPQVQATNKVAIKTSIEKIKQKKEEFKDKKVTVEGEVVKVLRGIMNSSWVHIKDLNSDEILIFKTPFETVNNGDKVEATGVVNTNVDYGYGYIYEIMVLNAQFQTLGKK